MSIILSFLRFRQIRHTQNTRTGSSKTSQLETDEESGVKDGDRGTGVERTVRPRERVKSETLEPGRHGRRDL